MLSTIKTEQLMGIFTYTSRQKFFFSTIFFLSGLLSAWAQCPTIVDATPSFCDTESPRVSMLNTSVTDGGAGIAWYANETGGSPLAGTTQLINGTTYYVDQAVGSCGVRQSVQVTIYSTPLTKDNKAGVVICITDPNNLPTLQGSIIDLNEFIGTDLKFYAGEFSVDQLLGTHVLSDGELIYASQTNPETGCETTRGVLEIIFRNATTPTGESPQNFCNDPDAPAPLLSNIVTVGGNTYYDSPTATLRLNPNTPMVNGTTYYISRVSGSCESDRLPVEVLLDEILQPEPSTPLEYCINNIAQNNVNLFDQFTVKPAQTGTWSTTAPVTFSNPSDFNGNINLSTLLEGSYTFTYTVPSTTTCPDQVNTVTVNIVPLPNAGTDGAVNFCTDEAATDLFLSLNPSNGVAPEAGGTWTFLGTNTPHSGTFDPATDLAGQYEYRVERAPCDPSTAIVTVTKDSQVNIGSGKSIPYCETKLGTLAEVNLFAEITGLTDTNGVWTNEQGIVMGGVDHLRTVDPNTFTVEGSPYTFTYTLPQVGECDPKSVDVTIIIEEFKIPGEDAEIKICSNQGPVDLFPVLNGTPSTGGIWTGPSPIANGIFDPAVHLPGDYLYTINNEDCVDGTATVTVIVNQFVDPGTSASVSPICVTNVATTPSINLFEQLGGTPVLTGTWTGPAGFVINGGHLGTVDISGMDTTGITEVTNLVFTYTVPSEEGCEENFATITIPIEPIPNAGEDNLTPQPVCSTGTFDLMTLLGGTPQQNGVWTNSNNQVVTNPLDLATALSGTYKYTITSIGCNATDEATVALNIQPLQNAGQDATVPAVCISALPTIAPFNLFERLGGTPSTGGTWSGPIPTSGGHLGTVNIQTLTAGTHVFTYTIAAVGQCLLQDATVSITINEQLIAGTSTSRSVCSTSGTVNLFSQLGGNPSPGGTWTYVPTNTPHSGIFNPLADAPGAYRYRVVSEGCATQIATVTMSVDIATNPGVGASRNFCETQLGTLGNLNLFSVLTGTPQTTGTWAGPVATQGAHLGTLNLDALAVGSYAFVYTTPANGQCTAPTATVTINIDPIPNAGTAVSASRTVCTSDTSFDLMTLLTGAQLGGVWTVDGNPVASTTFNPATSPAGIYTYTVTSLGCVSNQTDTESITINKTQAPNAGENGVRNVCISDVASLTAVNLFGLLQGSPANTGTWSGPTPTSGGNLGTVDLSGLTVGSYVYTYTVTGSGSCNDSSKTVTIFIDDVPSAGTINASNRPYCTNEGTLDLNTLLDNEQVGGVWINASNQVVASQLNLSTATAGDYTYTVTSIGCGGQQDSKTITLTIQQAPNAGQALAPTRVCISNVNSTSINLFTLLGNNPSTNGTWSPRTGVTGDGNSAVLNLSGFAVGRYDYTYSVAGVGACATSPDTETVVVFVESLNPNQGTVISAKNIVCASQAPFDLHDLIQNEDLGGTWSFNSNNLSSTIFDPASSPAGRYTYSIASASCNVNNSKTVNVDIEIRNVLPIANSLTATSASICSGTSTSVSFTGTPDAVITYQVNGGANQTVTLDSTGNAVVQTGNLSSNSTYTAVSASFPGPLSCSQVLDGSATTTVTVNPLSTATISGTQAVCEGSNPSVTITGTPNAVVTYRIGSGNEIDLNLGATGTQIITINNIQDTVTYTLVRATSDKNCPQVISNQSATVTVNKFVNPVILASSLTVCDGSTGNLVVTPNVANALATLTYNIDGGTSQTVVLDASGTAIITTGVLNQNVTINLLRLQTAIDCARDLVNISFPITVTPLPTVTSFAVSSDKVCSGGNSIATVQGTPNTTVTYNDGTANRTVALDGNGVGTIALSNITSDISLTLVSIANTCPNSATGNVSISVIPLPNVAAANVSISSASVCYETANTVSITNATDLDGDYVINYTLSGAISLGRSTTVNFAGGTGSFVINSSDVNGSGTVTVTIQDIASVVTGCSVSGATFNNTVNFTVYPKVPDATLKPRGEAFCSKENPVVSALTSRLNLAQGTIVRWFEDITGGVPLADNVSLINGETYYAEVESVSNGCTTSSRLEVIVDTNKCLLIPEGFSPNDDGINDLLVFENLDFYYPDYTVEIYNRYGNKLYTGNAQSKPWDGRAGHGRIGSDDVLPTGVYFYILNYNVAGKESKQGVIYLSR